MSKFLRYSGIILFILAFSLPAWADEPKEIADVIAFTNVNLVTMADDTVSANQVLLVRGHKIDRFGPAGTVAAPDGAEVIDGQGGWLMPGLADMHVHTRPEWLTSAWPVNPLKLFLANGVTTIRCLGPCRGRGANAVYVLNWRQLIEEGMMDGPTIYTCGPILRGPVGNPAKNVMDQKANGFDFIKIYSYLTPGEFNVVMKTSQERGMYVTGHIPMMVGLEKTLSGGLNEIAHVEELAWEMTPFDRGRRDIKGAAWFRFVGLELHKRYQNDFSSGLEALKAKYRDKLLAVADVVKQSGVPVCTTLFLDQLIKEKLLQPDVFLARPEIKLMPAGYREDFRQGREKHQVQFKGAEDFTAFKQTLDLALLWALKEKGVPVLLGTDAGTGGMGIAPGVTLHGELAVLVENGYTPFEALASGTVQASRVMARITGRDEFGLIAPGRRADLVLVGGNPLEDVGQAQNIKGVMAAGRWYGADRVKQMGHIP